MSFHKGITAAAAAALIAAALPAPAAAQEIYVPLLTYRTGAFAGSGIPIADEQEDEVEKFREFLDNISPEDFETES